MKPILVDDFSRFRFLSEVTFSPEGDKLCFVVSQANMEKNGYDSWIYMKKDQEILQLTGGGKESTFQFLDNNTILFPGNREGEDASVGSRFYKLSLTGGEAKLAISLPIAASKLVPLDNGDFLVLGNTVPGFEDLYKNDAKLTKAYLAHKEEEADYEVVEYVPWWHNGGTFTKGVYQSVYYFDAKKKKLSRITKEGFCVGNIKISPDKKHVFVTGHEDKPMYKSWEESLYKLDIESGELTAILLGSEKFFLFDVEMGQDFAVGLFCDDKDGGNTNPDFYKVDYETLELTPYAKFGEAIGSSVGSDIRYGGGRSTKMVGNDLYFITTLFDGAYIYKLSEGQIASVVSKDGSADCFDIYDDQIAMVGLYDMKGQELYDGMGNVMTHFNDQLLKNKYVAQPEYLEAQGPDHEVHGFVLKPMNYDPEKSYPVILDIHGGPKTVYGPVFYHEMQYWATKGYFVIFCNPVGSDGRGDKFADIRGIFGTIDYDDIMRFVDKALEMYPQMDKEHLYETGGSYGGFMTNWIIGHTDRFRAVATQRSISNWVTMYGVCDIGPDFVPDTCLSDPWHDLDRMWEQSPMKHAANMKTPTLIIHSFEDYRCPVDQAYQLFTTLLEHGVESKMVLFRGENHNLSRNGKPKHRVRRINEITGWFDTHK